jgi:hypothetical protein
VEETAGPHLLRDRRHRFVNNFRLAIPAGLLGQAQIAQAKPAYSARLARVVSACARDAMSAAFARYRSPGII